MNDELLARCRSFIDEQSCGEWDDKAINEDAAKLYEFVQREAASALRLAAQSPEPVAWIDFADNGNVRLWTHKKARMLAEEAEGRKMTPVYTAPPRSASDGALLEAALAAMWRPISEAEPNRTYLLGWRDWRDDRWCMEVAPAVHGQRYETGYSNVSHHGSATHFMPLPSPPKMEG